MRPPTSRLRVAAVAGALFAALGLFSLAPLPLGSTSIHTEVEIARPPAQVFEYVTTPSRWPEWHPASLAVHGDAAHPLVLGEAVIEDFVVAGRRGRVEWTVTAREPARFWQIEGRIDGRQAGVIAYTLTPTAIGTRFRRDFRYAAPNVLFAIANAWSLRERLAAESDEAVTQLKRALEAR
jgi:uncharacterized protein YndB with AHSA1/START domain